MKIKTMYAVVELMDGPIYGIYNSIADAQEAIFQDSDDWAYEVIMRESGTDVLGHPWHLPEDHITLMLDSADNFRIEEVTVYDY